VSDLFWCRQVSHAPTSIGVLNSGKITIVPIWPPIQGPSMDVVKGTRCLPPWLWVLAGRIKLSSSHQHNFRGRGIDARLFSMKIAACQRIERHRKLRHCSHLLHRSTGHLWGKTSLFDSWKAPNIGTPGKLDTSQVLCPSQEFSVAYTLMFHAPATTGGCWRNQLR